MCGCGRIGRQRQGKQSMKDVRAWVFLAPLLAGWVVPAQAEGCQSVRPAKGVILTLTLKRTALRPGDRLPATVTLRNSGKAALAVPLMMEPEDHWIRYSISDSAGNISRYIGPEYKAGPAQDQTFELMPSYQYGVRFDDLARLYKLEKPGVYQVQALYGRGPDTTCPIGLHRSNTVSITVHARKSSDFR